MAVPARLAAPYRVRFDESGPDGMLRPSGYLRYAQDLAWLHSTGSGFGREWYGERGLTWLVRAAELDVHTPARFGQLLEVSTEVLGFRRVWARRQSEFRHTDAGELLATAIIDWVLLNRAGSPTRVPADIVAAFPGVAEISLPPLRVTLPSVPANAEVSEFRARRSELDPMGHVNNAAYLDYVDELLAGTGTDDSVESALRRYQIEFVGPAGPLVTLRATGWPVDNSFYFLLDDADGRPLARAEVSS